MTNWFIFYRLIPEIDYTRMDSIKDPKNDCIYYKYMMGLTIIWVFNELY